MKGKITIACSAAALCIAAWASKDPVIMTVNGVDVPKSEFEYLYHKNSQQHLGNQSIDDYAEMFKIYKLKVADALAAGIDTTASFQNEFNGYRNELAAPYMVDSVYVESLIKEAFDRSREDIEAWHIMYFKQPDEEQNMKNRTRLDSIRNVILNGGDFEAMAKEYSQDKNTGRRGGSMGYLPSLIYPYSFETAVYNLPAGELSEVVESPAGYHLIKTGNRRPARGKVLVEHIMKLVKQGMTPDSEKKIKEEIDSIYNVITSDNFEELATKYSDDKGSARNGGKLPLFGTGQMVPEFEEMAFSMKDGEICKPFRTSYGWHIIKKLESKDPETFDEMKEKIRSRITSHQDERSGMIRDNEVAKLDKKYKGRRNSKAIAAMRADIGAAGLDSIFRSKYDTASADAIILYTIGNKKVSARDLARRMRNIQATNLPTAQKRFDTALDDLSAETAIEYGEEHLSDLYPEYRNLLKEYRDGMLLFEISNREVWDKASKDKEGLERYFNNHKSEYSWKTPHYKGWLIQAENDSVASLIKSRMPELSADTLTRTIRKEFSGKVQIDHFLIEQGKNPLIEDLMAGKTDIKPQNPKFNNIFLYGVKEMMKPEELNDVRGMVTSDYQNELEKEWIERLKAKYPVVINTKEMKKIK